MGAGHYGDNEKGRKDVEERHLLMRMGGWGGRMVHEGAAGDMQRLIRRRERPWRRRRKEIAITNSVAVTCAYAPFLYLLYFEYIPSFQHRLYTIATQRPFNSMTHKVPYRNLTLCMQT